MKVRLTLLTLLLLTINTLQAQVCVENNLGQNQGNITSGHTNVAQSFTASCAGSIISITLNWSALPSQGTNTNNRVLNIYDGAVCGSTLLHSQVIPYNSIVLGNNTFNLTVPVPINLGEVNTFEISDAGQTSDASRGVTFNTSSGYPGGSAWFSCSVLSGFDLTFSVTISNAVIVNIGSDTTVCPGQSVTLNAGNPGSTYLWSTGATSQTIAVTTPNTYWVSVTSPLGSTGRDTMIVSNHTVVPANIGPDRSLCPSDTVCFNAGNGVTYAWSNGSTAATICTSTPGSIDVTITDAHGCSSSDNATVTAVPNPIVDLGPDQDICTVDSICLSDGSAGLSYLWSDNSTANTLCVTNAGSYSLMSTDSNGCRAADTVEITANQLAVAQIQSLDTTGCPEIIFNNGSSNATSWFWDFGDVSTSTLESPTHLYTNVGTYNVTMIASNNCGSDTATISIEITCFSATQNGTQGSLTVYPNPSQGSFHVNCQALPIGIATFKVTTLSGQVLLSREADITASQHQEDFDLSHLSQGIYMLEVESNGNTLHEKIAITK